MISSHSPNMQTLEERKQRIQNIARSIRPLLNQIRWDQTFLPLSPNRLKAIYKALKGLKHVLENVTRARGNEHRRRGGT
jgi:hypothetical protein